MQSLKLDADGDLMFEDGELMLVSGDEELAQAVQINLNTNKGEWFLNPEMGLTFKLFSGKNLSEEEMRDDLITTILQEPRIDTVDEITFKPDYDSRTLEIRFTATGIDGEVINEVVNVDAG